MARIVLIRQSKEETLTTTTDDRNGCNNSRDNKIGKVLMMAEARIKSMNNEMSRLSGSLWRKNLRLILWGCRTAAAPSVVMR